MPALRCLALLFVPVVRRSGVAFLKSRRLATALKAHAVCPRVLTNIKCELRGALNDVRAAYPQGSFLDEFGIETTLTLTLDEEVMLVEVGRRFRMRNRMGRS